MKMTELFAPESVPIYRNTVQLSSLSLLSWTEPTR